MGCACCILAFCSCYIIVKCYHHLPQWFIFPPISFLGYRMPEHITYALFFTLGAVCFFVSFFYIRRHSFQKHRLWLRLSCLTPRERDEYSQKWMHRATAYALWCPLFLTIQAVIPLQADILDVLSVFLSPS